MTVDDREGFATLMLGLGETYGEPVSDARMEIYFGALADQDLETLRRAATLHVRTQKFFPRPAELREAINGSLDDRAELAWMALLREVRRAGYTGAPEWHGDAALERAAMELYGGWQRLCGSLPADGPELLGYAKQFKATYRAYDTRAQMDALPPGADQELSADDARKALGDFMARFHARS